MGRPRLHVSIGRAWELVARGYALSTAAKELGCSRTTLKRVLSEMRPDTPLFASFRARKRQ